MYIPNCSKSSSDLLWVKLHDACLINCTIKKITAYGRYNLPAPLPVEERACWFCMEDPPVVEDEVHFLFNCYLYNVMKKKAREFINHCKVLNKAFFYTNDIDKWKFIPNSNKKLLIFLYSKFSFEKQRSHIKELLLAILSLTVY